MYVQEIQLIFRKICSVCAPFLDYASTDYWLGSLHKLLSLVWFFKFLQLWRQSLAKSALTGKPLQILFVVTVVISLVYQIFAALETKTFLSLVFS